MEALVKWCVFCVVTGRRMAIDQDQRRYFDIGDRDDLSYEGKLQEYRALADEYFQVAAYEEFCAAALPSMRELVVEYVGGPQFDQLLVDIVRGTFPANEHDQMVERHRSLLGTWVREQTAAGPEARRST
jgi:hypothetical protein